MVLDKQAFSNCFLRFGCLQCSLGLIKNTADIKPFGIHSIYRILTKL